MDELNHGINKKCSTNPIFKIENYFQMDPVNIWASNLGLKINIWPFLIHFMQPNVSLIKKLMMHIDFLGKNLYPVGRAKLSSTSVVTLMVCMETWHQRVKPYEFIPDMNGRKSWLTFWKIQVFLRCICFSDY